MATKDYIANLKIEGEVSGIGDFDKLATELETIAKEAGLATPEINKLAADLRKLGDQQATIAGFEAAAKAVDDYAKQVEAADKEMAGLAQEQAKAAKAAADAAQAQSDAVGKLDKAKQANAALKEEVKKAAEELKKLREESKKGADPKLAQSVNETKEKLQGLREQAKQSREEVKRLGEAQREAAKEQRATATAAQQAENAYKKSVDSTGKLVSALGQQNRAMEQSRTALEQAGINSKDLGKAQQQLAQDMTRARQQAEQSKTALQNLGKAGEEVKGKFDGLAKTMAGLFAASKLKQYALEAIEVADAYGAMAEGIKMATPAGEDFDQIQNRLLETANRTYRALEEQQQLYINTADALRSLGYTTQEALDVQDSFSYLLVTNAASADKAQSAMDAYTQSLNSGKVSAEQWASIMAAIPSVVDSIAAASGKTTAEVRKLGVEGKMSVDLLNESLRQSVEINGQMADEMKTTVADAVTALKNSWTKYIGDANAATQTTQKIASAIELLKDNLDTVVKVATLAGEAMVAAWAVKGLNALMVYTAQLKAATVATNGLAAATASGAAKMGAALAAAGKLAMSFWVGWEIGTMLREQFEIVEAAGIKLAETMHGIAFSVKAAFELAKAAMPGTDEKFSDALKRINAEYEQMRATYAEMLDDVGKQKQASAELAAAKEQEEKAVKAAVQTYQKLTGGYKDAADEAKKLTDTAKAEVEATKQRGDALQKVVGLMGDEVAARKAAGDAAREYADKTMKLAEAHHDELLALRELEQAQKEALATATVGLEEKQKEYEATLLLLEAKEKDAAASAAQAVEAERLARATGEVVQAALAAKDAAELSRIAKTGELNTTIALLETQKRQAGQAEEIARLMGNERAVRDAKIKQLEIEIKITKAKADVQRVEAEAAIMVAEATRAELAAKGQLTPLQQAQIEASIAMAQAKIKEAKVIDASTEVIKAQIASLNGLSGAVTNATNTSISAMQRLDAAAKDVGSGVEGVASAMGNATSASQGWTTTLSENEAAARRLVTVMSMGRTGMLAYANSGMEIRRLTEALDEADAAQRRLNDSLNSYTTETQSLEERLLQLEGREDEIAAKRQARERAELEVKKQILAIEMQKAQMLNDFDRVSDLQQENAELDKQLSILQKIHTIEKQQAQQSKAQAAQPAAAQPQAQAPAPAAQPAMNLPAQKVEFNISGVTDPAQLARKLEPELKRLGLLAR